MQASGDNISSGYNQEFYDKVWHNSRLLSHDIWPVWGAIRGCLKEDSRILEVGPGTRPKVPIKGSYFLEISSVAAKTLSEKGGNVLSQDELAAKEGFFDVVCAFEVLEHIQDDRQLLATLNSIMRAGARLFISVPVNQKHWSEGDVMAGHFRRYDPEALQRIMNEEGFQLECYAEDGFFSKIYGRRLFMGFAKKMLERFPRLSLTIESYCLLAACAYAKRFGKISWRKESLKVSSDAHGIYAVFRKTSPN